MTIMLVNGVEVHAVVSENYGCGEDDIRCCFFNAPGSCSDNERGRICSPTRGTDFIFLTREAYIKYAAKKLTS